MKLGITSIQRNRNPWIVEWLAFHMLAGFNRFYIYCHLCDDGMQETLAKLARRYPITAYAVESGDRPQLAAYQHAWDTHNADIDWMAFIDGDEFLFAPSHADVAEALAEYAEHPLSALAAYWICYGSNGHVQEPEGLIIENYPRHSGSDFGPNRHVKSIVRGGQAIQCTGSHLFVTPNGTYDEQLRLMQSPVLSDPASAPSHATFRINHYVTQSLAYYTDVKEKMAAADRRGHILRPEGWFAAHDRNECDDGVSRRFLESLKRKTQELQAVLREVS